MRRPRSTERAEHEWHACAVAVVVIDLSLQPTMLMGVFLGAQPTDTSFLPDGAIHTVPVISMPVEGVMGWVCDVCDFAQECLAILDWMGGRQQKSLLTTATAQTGILL